jgi:hypothetical protein
MSGAAARLVAAALVLAGSGYAVGAIGRDAANRDSATASEIALLSSKGPIRFHNSKHGRAIVHAQAMAPGDTRAGYVKVGIRGGDARVRLGLKRLASPAGPAGGELAGALRLEIDRVGGSRKRRVYAGRLDGFERARLGRWRSGQLHRYRVRVRFVDSHHSQDPLQGAQASFSLIWTAKPR